MMVHPRALTRAHAAVHGCAPPTQCQSFAAGAAPTVHALRGTRFQGSARNELSSCVRWRSHMWCAGVRDKRAPQPHLQAGGSGEHEAHGCVTKAYVRASVCVHACLWVSVCVCVRMHARGCVWVRASAWVHGFGGVCVRACVHLCPCPYGKPMRVCGA